MGAGASFAYGLFLGSMMTLAYTVSMEELQTFLRMIGVM